ncbi:MAG: 50S ribosomal protein L20 [Spirochaetales bacterium]|nr:50S ribosomal protein L20 [Spirochaetales bacterium]
MPRAVAGTKRKDRRKKVLKITKGFRGRRSTNLKTAKEAAVRALTNAYKDRKRKKREFRVLWIARISAACRSLNSKYSELVAGLKKSGIIINRKALSNMAIEDPQAFKAVLEQAQKALGAN